jgi:hypothetical protein
LNIYNDIEDTVDSLMEKIDASFLQVENHIDASYAGTLDKIDAIDTTKLTPADDAYYFIVTMRIEKKLLGAI